MKGDTSLLEPFDRNISVKIEDRDLERIKVAQEREFYEGISSALGKAFQLTQYNTFTGDPGFEARIPTLFRIYLRHGAKVCGPPAIDRRFKTIDYLVIFDVDAMDPAMFATYFE